MAVCAWCLQEMTTASSCVAGALHLAGRPVPMVPYGEERHWRGAAPRCGDCGVARGGWHHLGCDIQECPSCRRQMLSCGCRFDQDPPEDDIGDDDLPSDVSVDANGCLTEVKRIGGQEVIVHYDDVPESDITVVRGVRCTTALRTAIDLAPELEPERLEALVADFVARGLFTVADAHARIAQPDMADRRGAHLLRDVLHRRHDP